MGAMIDCLSAERQPSQRSISLLVAERGAEWAGAWTLMSFGAAWAEVSCFLGVIINCKSGLGCRERGGLLQVAPIFYE